MVNILKRDCSAIPGAGVVILVRSPHQLYENDEVFVQEMVTTKELAMLSGLVPLTEWQPL